MLEKTSQIIKYSLWAITTLTTRTRHKHIQPIPVLNHPFHEVIPPNVQTKPPLLQRVLSSCCWLCGRRALAPFGYSLLSGSCIEQISPEPPFPWGKPPQLPQLLLVDHVHHLHHVHHEFCYTSADKLQHLNVPSELRGPKLSIGLEVQPRQCKVQGKNQFSGPADHTMADKGQDAVSLLGHRGTAGSCSAAVDQDTQVLFHRADFQPSWPEPVVLHWVVMTEAWTWHSALLNLTWQVSVHWSSMSRSLWRPLLSSSRSTLPLNSVSPANLLMIL